jgi:hypothetical protein
VGDPFEIVEAHPGEPFEPERIELSIAEPDLEAPKLSQSGCDDHEPRRLQVPRAPGGDIWVPLGEEFTAVDRTPACVRHLIEEVRGEGTVVDEAALESV